MPASDSPSRIVARFLKANHYYGTLEAFLEEAGLPEDAANAGPDDWTIEHILDEKKTYDASLLYEKKPNDQHSGWSQPAPSKPEEPDFSISSNVLCVNGNLDGLMISTADRNWARLINTSPFRLSSLLDNAHNSPILSMQLLDDGLMLSTSMSGQLMLHHLLSGKLIGKCRHHLKYAVQVAYHSSSNGLLIATAGWDQKVHVYFIDSTKLKDSYSSTDFPDLIGDPIHTIELQSNPESILFARDPDSNALYIVLSRRDSTHLIYYSITSNQPSSSNQSFTISIAGRQNLAPHANAWVAFTPSCLAMCPKDPGLLAVATSHLPHMKLILVHLLFPRDAEAQLHGLSTPLTQASQARGELATQDREEAAITLHISAMAPQTPYSTPQVVWRPDGSGVWVNGDDGVIRGIEAKSGKIISLLKAHEQGSKVRTLWAGLIPQETTSSDEVQTQEVLVSGGFDKKAFVWMAERT